LLPLALAELAARRSLVLSAEPGAGKTTRLPRALLDASWLEGEIVVLEPRRLAARLAAERVAAELGERPGERVGYETRFERAVGPRTRVRFVTEGILTRRLLADPTLRGVGAVVFDELHERHLVTDVSLALTRSLQTAVRPELALVAMSATLDTDPIARFLGAQVVSVPGRAHPVEIVHLERPDNRPLAAQVAAAVADAVAREAEGHVLVFLPGAREIRLAAEACARLAVRRGLRVLPLFGSLSTTEQDLAVRPSPERKVILATNVAETSVTIDGVSAVVDAGLAFEAACSPWSGMPILKLAKIPGASAVQRAGRAGRTRPGTCLRLYTASDLGARPAFAVPEIARLDLSEAVLEIVMHGAADPRAFPWFEAPPTSSLDAAIALLVRLGAIEGEPASLRITPAGRRMLDFPVHPRQARIIVEGERRGVSREACGAAAVLGERGFVLEGDAGARATERSDVLALLDDLDHRRRALDPQRAATVLRTRERLERIAADAAPRPEGAAREEALLISILTGYPDRVGRLRRPEGRGQIAPEVLLASGATAVLGPSSRVREAELVVAVDAEERREGTRTRNVVRLASAIEPDWLLDLYTDRIVDEEAVTIPPGGRRVESVRTLSYGSIVLERTASRAVDPARAAAVLAEAVLGRGLPPAALGDLERLAARIELLRAHAPEAGLAAPEPIEDGALVRAACEGRSSLDDLEGVDWAGLAMSRLPAEHQRALRELAPDRVTLASGRSARVEYVRAGPPSVTSRLQDFFGMREGPRVVRERVALVLHLAAPSGRPVQVTTDLAGFWNNHYPKIAKELRRKYPKHAWPDDPATSSRTPR
jgi:ATP-dependent helicase HrpB